MCTNKIYVEKLPALHCIFSISNEKNIILSKFFLKKALRRQLVQLWLLIINIYPYSCLY